MRSFITSPIPTADRDRIKAMLTMINTHEAGMHFEAFFDNNEPFKGFTRSYGFFRNPSNYIAAVVDTDFAGYYERAGYFAQQVVMNLTDMGIGSCYVGGTYDAAHVGVHLRAGRKILFLIVFGYEDTSARRPVINAMLKMMKRKNIAARQFFAGTDAEYDEAVKRFPRLPEYLEALDCAPSSLNKRPVRLRVREGEIELFLPEGCQPKQEIDLGIARFNVECLED